MNEVHNFKSKLEIMLHGIVIAVILICCSCTINKVSDCKDMDYYNDLVEIIEDKDGKAIVSGRNRAGNCFSFKLNYARADVILKKAYLMDFTNNNRQELCLELNVFNSVSPDLNTILIYDMENNKILFPTPDKAFVYDGYIDQIDIDHNKKNVIRYGSYTKINGTSLEDENSIIKWSGYSFTTLEYQNKLLVETDEYIVFYKKNSTKDGDLLKLQIFDANTLQAIQEIELRIDEASITEKITNCEFITLTDSESYNLYIDDFGYLYWNKALKEFTY